jgi:type I restriction enzyme S subunit
MRQSMFISSEADQTLRRSRVQDGDILMTITGNVGRVIRLAGVGSANINQHIARIRIKDPRFDSGFVYHYLAQRTMREYFNSIVTGQAYPQIGLAQVRATLIPSVDIDQQRKIAAALDDADDVIATLERLIAKKQAIKQGMMQQLLTARTRLPGFTGEWIATTLGELGMFLKGRGVKRDDVRATGIPCIRYGELYTEFIDYTASTRSFVSRDVASTALPIRSGDLLFAGSGETRAEIGMCVAYVGDAPAVAGGDIVVLRGDTFNPVYLATLANSPMVTNQKARAGQGDAVVHISSRALAAVVVSLPPRPEQDAIAEVLVDADQEIEMLRGRLRKARAIKTGMMQQLLTGRTRLPVDSAS